LQLSAQPYLQGVTVITAVVIIHQEHPQEHGIPRPMVSKLIGAIHALITVILGTAPQGVGLGTIKNSLWLPRISKSHIDIRQN